MAYWTKTPNFVKINYDGSALSNLGSIGASGVVRDHQGNLIYGYAVPLCHGTKNQDELQSTIWGFSWCLNNYFWLVIMEIDSNHIVKWIKQHATSLWNLQ